MHHTTRTSSLLYQASIFLPYSERLIHGFTGKPLSLGGPDTPQNPKSQVAQNRALLLEELGITGVDWISPKQVHGHRIGRLGDQAYLQTDGILLTRTHQPVMLTFADCVPVLLYDPVRHGGAVIHAGWRGTAQGIVQEAVLAFQNVLGSSPQDILAAIGPAISLCCFQVSFEVAETLAEAMTMDLTTLEAKGFLAWDEGYPNNPRLDLKALNQHQLLATGVEQIEVLSACTRCQETELFSFRRGEDGRNAALMMLW